MSKDIKKNRQKILVIVGPTASGKSDLAVSMAKKFNGEIISADSRQVYRGMDIGTGKITKREMKGVRHHLLDMANPKRRFSAEKYRILARAAIDDIVSRGKLPIICGGTGFYIDAVLDENPFPNVPPNLKLRKKLSKKSPADLLLILKKLDPKRARVISKSNSEKNNQRRIIRAIEIALSAWSAETSPMRTKLRFPQQKYSATFIGIKLDTVELKKRIRNRLGKRLKHGMIAEARRLHTRGLSWKRMDELGLEYKYMAQYLQMKMPMDELIETLSAKIWQYARRQKTWWRKDGRIRWYRPEEVEKMETVVATCN
jgi:tRNA dimethylallyltransferase